MIAASEARRRAGRRGFAGELGASPFSKRQPAVPECPSARHGASSFPPRFSAAGTTPSPSTGVGGVSDLGRDGITGIREEPAGGESTRSESAVSSGPSAVIGESQQSAYSASAADFENSYGEPGEGTQVAADLLQLLGHAQQCSSSWSVGSRTHCPSRNSGHARFQRRASSSGDQVWSMSGRVRRMLCA